LVMAELSLARIALKRVAMASNYGTPKPPPSTLAVPARIPARLGRALIRGNSLPTNRAASAMANRAKL
jgi:hypothetical protein